MTTLTHNPFSGKRRAGAAKLTPKPTCAVCAASMIAAEASALATDGVVSYLWSCDICGYGFVTETPPIQPNH